MNADAIRVTAVSESERRRGLELLFGHLAGDEREAAISGLLESVADGDASLGGLRIAWRAFEPVGAALFVERPDRTAFLWPPSVRDGDESAADALVAAACEAAAAGGVTLVQILLEPDDRTNVARLQRHGFTQLARLTYLVRWLTDPLPPAESGVELETYDPAANHERLVQVVERTYVATKDCPNLAESRPAAEAVDGHRHAGEFDPRRWWIARVDERDAGVVLMNEHARENGWEVVYVGVDPAFRGHGLGRALTLHGLHAARAAGRERVLLAADVENDVALRIYLELGFMEIAQRDVLTLSIEQPSRAGAGRG